MRSASPRRRGNARWSKHQLDLAKAGALFRDYAPPPKGDPLTAMVYMDGHGLHRRAILTYPENWKLQVNFDLQGRVSSFQLSCALRGIITKDAA